MMQTNERRYKIIKLICDADRRENLLSVLGEDDLQYLSPKIDEVEKWFVRNKVV